MSDNTLRSEKWRRLERVIKWTGLSINSFALTIGLKRSENLYQIKKGNNGISRDLAELITAKYPSVSKGWLLTGEGEMLIGNKAVTGSGSGIPYYGMDATVAVEQQLPPPLFYINVPIFNDCDLSAMALGTAMQPDIPAGSIVLLKKWDVKAVVPGESYLIISAAFKGFRIIRRSEQADELLCRETPKSTTPSPLNKAPSKNCLSSAGLLSRKFCDLCLPGCPAAPGHRRNSS